jgi:hypothetical protein
MQESGQTQAGSAEWSTGVGLQAPSSRRWPGEALPLRSQPATVLDPVEVRGRVTGPVEILSTRRWPVTGWGDKYR